MKIDVDLNDHSDQSTPVAVATTARSTSTLPVGGDARISRHRVLEAQRLLEVEIAGLAASHCTPDDIDRLAQILEEMELNRTAPQRFLKAEQDFHMALAQATQDALYSRLQDAMSDIHLVVRHAGWQDDCISGQVLACHRAIFDQVATGDAEGARQAMRGYVEQGFAGTALTVYAHGR